MKQLLACLILFILNTGHSNAQNFQAYQLYTANGKAISFEKALKDLGGAEVILFGELHNNPIDHWLQLELSRALLAKNSRLVLGAEMFETDNQTSLDSYISGEIDAKALDTLARLWPNYETDYQPLVDFARDTNLRFIATNIPRRYAKMVYMGGFEALDSLPDSEKQWIAPLPVLYDAMLPGYQDMLAMAQGHGGDNLPKAQAIKDATMAHNILQNLIAEGVFIHFNGDYHSANFEGISWYLKQVNPNLKISTISTVLQSDVDQLSDENRNRADYILVIDEDMTSTY